MKIYYKKTEEESPELNELLKEAKIEFDEAWLKKIETEIPTDMDQRLQATIDHLAAEEPSTQTEPRIGHHAWLHIAACTLVLLALGIGLKLENSTPAAFTDTCKTPEEAQLQLERALSIINQQSNKSLELVEKNCQKAQEASTSNLSRFITFE